MKLKVKDSKGKILKVVDACVATDAEGETEELTKTDIKKLKRLLPHLDDLLQLLELEEQEHDKDFVDDEIEGVINAEANKKEEDGEDGEEKDVKDGTIDGEDDDELKALTQNVKAVNDSKRSFGAIERRKVTDSLETEIDRDNEVALAWAKRYNGGN